MVLTSGKRREKRPSFPILMHRCPLTPVFPGFFIVPAAFATETIVQERLHRRRPQIPAVRKDEPR